LDELEDHWKVRFEVSVLCVCDIGEELKAFLTVDLVGLDGQVYGLEKRNEEWLEGVRLLGFHDS
jgi:hypothetical protein